MILTPQNVNLQTTICLQHVQREVANGPGKFRLLIGIAILMGIDARSLLGLFEKTGVFPYVQGHYDPGSQRA